MTYTAKYRHLTAQRAYTRAIAAGGLSVLLAPYIVAGAGGPVAASAGAAVGGDGVSGGCVPCRVCGGDQTRGWHRHDSSPATERLEELRTLVEQRREFETEPLSKMFARGDVAGTLLAYCLHTIPEDTWRQAVEFVSVDTLAHVTTPEAPK